MTRAIPGERGCGTRQEGGVYFEVGLSTDDDAKPIEHFLLDPARPLPEGWGSKELANKLKIFKDDQGIHHIISWIGAKHYPYIWDFIEEARRYGISRRAPKNFDFGKITQESLLILCHPRVINESWQENAGPDYCGKAVVGHQHHVAGPCLFQVRDLIPTAAGDPIPDSNHYFRTIGTTTYRYAPSGEEGKLIPGVFAMFHLTGICMVRNDRTAETDAVLENMRRVTGIEVFESRH